jgi:hypothetical protein
MAQRKESLYCSELAEALSLLIDACDDPALSAAEEEEEPELPVLASGGYCTGGRPRVVDRSSDLSQWSSNSDSSADSVDSAGSAGSGLSGRSSTSQSSSSLWRRHQQVRTILFADQSVKVSKEVRIKGAVYVFGNERKKWDGRQWRLVCSVEGCTAATRSMANFCIAHGRCNGIELK